MRSLSALERLLCHAEWLTRLARSLVRDAALADDLVQETWIAALRHPPDAERPARPWLSAVIRRLAALQMRREGVRAAYAPDFAGAAPAADETAHQVEQQRRLAGAVLALEEPYRSTILLRYYRGISAARVAREQGVPAATVRTRSKRGLARLREELDRASGGDGRSWVSALAPLASMPTSALSLGGSLIIGGIMAKVVTAAAVATVVLVASWWFVERSRPQSKTAEPAALTAEHDATENDLATPTDDPGATAASSRESLGSERATDPPRVATTLLTVRVVGRGSRDPLANVAIGVLPEEEWVRGGSRSHWSETDPAHLNEWVLTKADGVARFDVRPGERLHLHADGRSKTIGSIELVVDPLEPGEMRESTVELPIGPDLRFFGRVVDDSTGMAIADVPVLVEDYVKTATDAEGYFVVDGLSWGRQHARIEAPRYGLTLTVLVPGHETREQAQVVRLFHSASLLVKVRDASAARLDAYEVSATTGFSGLIRPRTSRGDTTGWNPTWSSNMDEGGRAELHDIPPGVEVNVELRQSGVVVRRLRDPIVLTASERRELTFDIGSGARVFGHAREPSGEPVVGLEIWLVSAEGTRNRYFHAWDADKVQHRVFTDDDGAFEFRDVPLGDWLVGPRGPEHQRELEADAPAPLAQLVSVPDVGGAIQVNIDVARGLVIRGVLLGADREPRHGYWVRLQSESLDGQVDVKSDAQGGFVVGPLVPGDYTLQGHGAAADRDSLQVAAHAGQEESVTLVLEPGAEIRGRTVDARTGAPCAAEVRLMPSESPLGYVGWGSSTRAGDFHFESLEPGTYHALARTDDGRISMRRDVRVEKGQCLEGVDIRLEPGAILVVSDAGATEARGFGLTHEGVHAGHGFVGPARISQQTLFAGRTILYTRGEERTIELDLVPGERRELDLSKN